MGQNVSDEPRDMRRVEQGTAPPLDSQSFLSYMLSLPQSRSHFQGLLAHAPIVISVVLDLTTDSSAYSPDSLRLSRPLVPQPWHYPQRTYRGCRKTCEWLWDPLLPNELRAGLTQVTVHQAAMYPCGSADLYAAQRRRSFSLTTIAAVLTSNSSANSAIRSSSNGPKAVRTRMRTSS